MGNLKFPWRQSGVGRVRLTGKWGKRLRLIRAPLSHCFQGTLESGMSEPGFVPSKASSGRLYATYIRVLYTV